MYQMPLISQRIDFTDVNFIKECPLDTGPKQSVSFLLVGLKKSSREAAVLSVPGGEPGLLASQRGR